MRTCLVQCSLERLITKVTICRGLALGKLGYLSFLFCTKGHLLHFKKVRRGGETSEHFHLRVFSALRSLQVGKHDTLPKCYFVFVLLCLVNLSNITGV